MNMRTRRRTERSRAARNSPRWSAAESITPARSNEPRFCRPPTAGSATTILPLLWLSAARPVYRTKRRFVEGNLEAALNEEPRAGADRKLTSNEEALLVATACSSPPEGCARWTLELLAGAMVKLTDHDSLSRETVRRRLAENHLKPWQKDMWCIPKVDAEYVARMEDVLDLYAEQPDPKRPVVCFDESPSAAHRRSAPADPGGPGTARTFRLRVSPQRRRQSLRLP